MESSEQPVNNNQEPQKIAIDEQEEDFVTKFAMAPAKKTTVTTNPSSKSSFSWTKGEGELVVDIFQTETDFFVQTAIAGITPNNIDVVVENKMMVIKGERIMPMRPSKVKNISNECHWGTFSKQIALPENVDTRNIKASLKMGILTIQMPLLAPPDKKVSVKIQ